MAQLLAEITVLRAVKILNHPQMHQIIASHIRTKGRVTGLLRPTLFGLDSSPQWLPEHQANQHMNAFVRGKCGHAGLYFNNCGVMQGVQCQE